MKTRRQRVRDGYNLIMKDKGSFVLDPETFDIMNGATCVIGQNYPHEYFNRIRERLGITKGHAQHFGFWPYATETPLELEEEWLKLLGELE